MPRDRWLIEENAATAVLILGDAEIAGLVAAFEDLAEIPTATPDSYSLDAQGRPLANRIAGKFVIGYWPEHRARRLHILRIDPLDSE
jgi:hypothetical protein